MLNPSFSTCALISAVVVLSISLGAGSQGCIHMSKEYDRSKFRETSREALMWRGKSDPDTVNLVVKSGVKGELPEDMAWVFPLPSVPDDYKEIEGDIFSELGKFFSERAPIPRGAPPGMWRKGMIAQGIIVHEKETVGDYEIVPIEIADEAIGGEALNQWLRRQGYAEVGEEIQGPYLKKGAAFLAIKVKPKSDSTELKPLLIRYRSEEMRFPLRFSHNDRTFDLNLYLLHEAGGEVSGVPDGVADGWGYQTQETEEAIRECPSLAETLRNSHGDKISRVALHGANSEFMIRDLSEDPGI